MNIDFLEDATLVFAVVFCGVQRFVERNPGTQQQICWSAVHPIHRTNPGRAELRDVYDFNLLIAALRRKKRWRDALQVTVDMCTLDEDIGGHIVGWNFDITPLDFIRF